MEFASQPPLLTLQASAIIDERGIFFCFLLGWWRESKYLYRRRLNPRQWIHNQSCRYISRHSLWLRESTERFCRIHHCWPGRCLWGSENRRWVWELITKRCAERYRCMSRWILNQCLCIPSCKYMWPRWSFQHVSSLRSRHSRRFWWDRCLQWIDSWIERWVFKWVLLPMQTKLELVPLLVYPVLHLQITACVVGSCVQLASVPHPPLFTVQSSEMITHWKCAYMSSMVTCTSLSRYGTFGEKGKCR